MSINLESGLNPDTMVEWAVEDVKKHSSDPDCVYKSHMSGVMRGYVAAIASQQPRITELESVNVALISGRNSYRDKFESECTQNDVSQLENRNLKSANKDMQSLLDALKFDYDAMLKDRAELMEQNPVGFVKETEMLLLSYSGFAHIEVSRIRSVSQQGFHKQVGIYAKPMPPAIPDGMVLVPVEPTDAMIQAGRDTPMDDIDDESEEAIIKDYKDVYRNMISAAQKGGE